ncbi:MAG: hypothetical protein HN380_07220 [Victivallales bacterium]|nr:hypothetical protein [Victivallales bacterium]
MSTPDFSLDIVGNALVLQTPWQAAALPAETAIDGHAAGPWQTETPSCCTSAAGPWQLAVDLAGHGSVRLSITNASAGTLTLGTAIVARWRPEAFAPALVAGDFREFIHGGSFLAMNCGVKVVGRKLMSLDHAAPSSMVTVYQHDDGTALLLGVLPGLGDGFAEFATLHAEPHLDSAFGWEARQVFQRTVAPGETVLCSPMTAFSGSDGTRLLTAYGELWRERNAPRERPIQVGWNSWDHHAGAVTRASIDENLAASRRLFGDTMKVFCIDEGYEVQWGTWAPNAKFPEGLADYCRHVKANGGVPGIWTAPLLVNCYNPLYFEHPEWFAERADGQVQTDAFAYGPMAYLDVTRDDVLDHIRAVFEGLRALGFEYFKVDFCHCILKATRFSDPSVGRAALIRRAFETIREGIGPEPYLLGCGAPYESVYGSVDAVRTTGDIHIFWGHILRNAAMFAARYWMQGNLWNCDPDFLVVRGPETAAPPYGRRQITTPMGPDGGWISGREFNEAEARAYALLVHLTGGDVILGDHLPALFENGVEMLRKTLQPRPDAAVPVDLFTTEQDLPRIWISRGEEDTLVGLFNWTEKPAHLAFDPAEHGLAGRPVDFWTDEPVPALPSRLPRRGSLALRYLR